MALRGMAVGKMVVRNSTLGAHLAGAAPWSSVGARTTTPKDPAGTTPVILYNSDDYFPAGVGPTCSRTSCHSRFAEASRPSRVIV